MNWIELIKSWRYKEKREVDMYEIILDEDRDRLWRSDELDW